MRKGKGRAGDKEFSLGCVSFEMLVDKMLQIELCPLKIHMLKP